MKNMYFFKETTTTISFRKQSSYFILKVALCESYKHLVKISPASHVYKKSQHSCVRWALREHLTPPCSDFACVGLRITTKLIKSSSYDIKIPLPI